MPKPGRPPAGRVKVLVSLDPQHVAALREEAMRQAKGLRPDASAVLRQILDGWVKRREQADAQRAVAILRKVR